jgi:Tfp pilus assembly pilus retraction ATPase PilT
VFDISGDDLDVLKKEFHTLADFKRHLDDVLSSQKTAQVSRVFEDIIAAALSMNASDIHMEPEEHDVRLRLRLDGMLQDAYTFETKVYRSINSRVKLLSGLKLNVENRAQDGRFTIAVGGTEIEVRTSMIPGNYGESIVLRLLDPKTLGRSFEDMGVNAKLLARLRQEILRPNGMLLTTGPTGSGKTTTLYTFLRALHTPDTKIVTIEDPVEYHLPGIVQTQIDGKDYTFASGLRSILRQDPDIILVGEIRDGEVAETALQAALTCTPTTRRALSLASLTSALTRKYLRLQFRWQWRSVLCARLIRELRKHGRQLMRKRNLCRRSCRHSPTPHSFLLPTIPCMTRYQMNTAVPATKDGSACTKLFLWTSNWESFYAITLLKGTLQSMYCAKGT